MYGCTDMQVYEKINAIGRVTAAYMFNFILPFFEFFFQNNALI